MPNNKNKLTAPKKLKILVTICERNKCDFYMSALESIGVAIQSHCFASGTDPRNKNTLLEQNKAVIFSFVDEDLIPIILTNYEDKYRKTHNGKAVAFVLPIDSVIGVTAYKLLLNAKEE